MRAIANWSERKHWPGYWAGTMPKVKSDTGGGPNSEHHAMFDLFTKPFASWTLIDVGMLGLWMIGAVVAGIVTLVIWAWRDGT